jgi:DNA mismatch endonuclease (patch repair protein)
MRKKIDSNRSATMRAVTSKNTKPELAVRSLIHRLGFRFRLHRKDIPGNPDIAFPCRRKVIFINGCFWHGHDCTRGARVPINNRDYWTVKIARNKARDARHLVALAASGWQALTLWECELRDQHLQERIKAFLTLYP